MSVEQLVISDFIPRQHCTPAGHVQGGIASLLLPGAGNAVPLRRLAAADAIETGGDIG